MSANPESNDPMPSSEVAHSRTADTTGGVTFPDPFRLLEDDTTEVRAWQARLTEEARSYVRRSALFPELLSAVEDQLRDTERGVPVRAGAHWLRVDRGPDGTFCLVNRLTAPAAPGQQIIRANDLEPEPASIDWFSAAPDGELLALGISSAGDEQSALYVVRVSDGALVGRRLSNASGGALAWLPDSSGFYCLLGDAPDHVRLRKSLHQVQINGPVAVLEIPEHFRTMRMDIQLSSGGRYLALLGHPAAPQVRAFFDRREHRWLSGPEVADGTTFAGCFLGESYIAVTTVDAPNGRLVSVMPASVASEPRWREEVPEGPDVLRAVTICGDQLVLCYYAAGGSRLVLRPLEGGTSKSVPLPGMGLIGTEHRAPSQYGTSPPLLADADGLTFSFSTQSRSPVLMRYHAKAERLEALSEPLATFRTSGSLDLCESSGDARVHYEVVQDERTDDRPAPTLLVVYGGWNAISESKGYPALFAPFIKAGGKLVYGHVRGDATFGAAQWLHGRGTHKRRSIEDVIAIAEHLLSNGVAEPERLGLWGVSNGAMVACGAVVRRPELFRAVVSLLPLCDMCRFVNSPFGIHLTWEYGDPRKPADAEAIRTYSPYHNTTDGVRYPATWIACAENDLRTPPWHARKMVAALRHATVGPWPILLRVHSKRGHEAGESTSSEIAAERLTFVMNELMPVD